jgi:hypothetical protein
MKQIISIFFILVIVYTTIGVKINAHHCLTSNTTDYSILKKENCFKGPVSCCKAKTHTNDCCTDETRLVHLGQDIYFSAELTVPSQILIGFLFSEFSIKEKKPNRLDLKEIKGRAPPLLYEKESRQALNQVFII